MLISEDVSIHLASYLALLTQPDTETIRQAETALKALLKDPKCMAALMEILKSTHSQPLHVRHIAGTILQKRLPRHYDKLDDVSTKIWIKSEILNCLAQEPDRAIRTCLVGVAASLLELECSSIDTSWPELFQFIAVAAATTTTTGGGGGSSEQQQQKQQQTAQVRELAFHLLQEITERIRIQLKPQYKPIAGMISNALVPEEDYKVQKAAVKLLGRLLSDLKEEPKVDIFAVFIPYMLQIARQQQHNNNDDKELILIVWGVLTDLAYSPSQAVSAHLTSMVSFGLECIVNSENLGIDVCDSATEAIVAFVEVKPKRFGKEKELLAQAVETLLSVIGNSPESATGDLFVSNPAYQQDLKCDDDGGGGEGMDTDTVTVTVMAQRLLDKLALKIPNKYIFQPVFSACIQNIHSPQPNQRKAGISGLSMIAEGCAEPLKEHLNEILPHILQAARDTDVQVKESSCFCLGQISEYCQPEILGYSDQIFPVLLGLLEDQAVVVQATSCYALKMFCEVSRPDLVRPFLDLLVKKLSSILETTDKRSVQEIAIAALGAAAVGAGVEFAPYTADVSKLITKFTASAGEKLYSLQGRALHSMGHIAVAVGCETFRPYFQAIMECAFGGLKCGSPSLNEYICPLFSNLAMVMKEDFSPFLSEVVPRLITIICTDEGELEPVEEAKQARDFSALDDSEDEDNEGGEYVLYVNPELTEVRKFAITAIGQIAAHTGPAFSPHLVEVVKVLQSAANESNPSIKSEAALALPNLVKSSVAADCGDGILWTDEEGVSGAILVDSVTAELTTEVLAQLIALMQDDYKETVTKACAGIELIINLRGSSAIAPFADECMRHAYNLLTKAAPCQGSEKPDGEQPGEDDDYDVAVQAACELVVGFCKALGAQFVHHLPRFLTAICSYSKHTRPMKDRIMVLSCLSDIALVLEGAIFDFWLSAFMPAITTGLADPSEQVKRNAAYCAGVCCEHLKERATDQYPTILQGLEPLFSIDPSRGESFAACVDNVAACIARMIMASPLHVPMSKVLPAMLKLLPLKVDMAENETVYSCLLGLVQIDHPDALMHKAEIRRVFTEATAPGNEVDEEIKQRLSQTLPFLES